MSAAMPAFNTLKHVDALKTAGMPEAQARATVQLVADAFSDNTDHLATKDDIKHLDGHIKRLETELRGEINLVRTEFRGEIKALHSEISMVKWMSGPVALVALVWIAKEGLKIFGVTG